MMARGMSWTVRRRAGVLALVVLALAGCGGSSSGEPAPTRTTAPRTETDQDLRAAMPGRDDVPKAVKTSLGCPDDREGCSSAAGVSAEQSRSFELAPLVPLTSTERERTANAPSVKDTVSVSAKTYDTVAAAEADVKGARSANAANNGSISAPAKKTGQGTYEPGLEGSGRVADESLQEWDGFFAARRVVLVDPEGVRSGAYIDTFLIVRSGATVVSSAVILRADGRGEDDAVELARTLVGDYLERLG